MIIEIMQLHGKNRHFFGNRWGGEGFALSSAMIYDLVWSGTESIVDLEKQ